MTRFVFIILLCWCHCGSILVRSHFEVIQDEGGTKISLDYDSLQQDDQVQINKIKFLKESRPLKFPKDFRTEYPPSVTYLLWLKNNKQFPKCMYDLVRSKYRDENLEWRINELSKLYKKCDIITGGYPLSGIYIRHLLDMINLQKRIDDHSIIQDINTKQDLENLRNIQLPKANNSTIRLHLRNEEEILKKVDPIGYLKALALKNPSVRNILYRKYLSNLQNDPSISEEAILKAIIDHLNPSRHRLQRRNSSKRRIMKSIDSAEGESPPILSDEDQNPINKIQNVIDLIEDNGLKISKSLRKELREVCKDYLNSYLEETYNLTNILTQYLEDKQLMEDTKFEKILDSDMEQKIDKIATMRDNELKSKETETFFADDNEFTKKKGKKHRGMMSTNIIIDDNDIKKKNITPGDAMYIQIKLKSKLEDEKNRRHKVNKFTEFLDSAKLYKKIKKVFAENNLMSKYDLTDVLETIGFDLSQQSKKDLTCLYGELLKNNQKAKLKKLFNEENFRLRFPNMNYDSTIDMLTSLMLSNINRKRKKNQPKLANVLENLGYNMTKKAKKKIEKLYMAKIKSNSKF